MRRARPRATLHRKGGPAFRRGVIPAGAALAPLKHHRELNAREMIRARPPVRRYSAWGFPPLSEHSLLLEV